MATLMEESLAAQRQRHRIVHGHHLSGLNEGQPIVEGFMPGLARHLSTNLGLATHQDQVNVGVRQGKADRGRDRDRQAMIPTHAVNGEPNGHDPPGMNRRALSTEPTGTTYSSFLVLMTLRPR